MRRALGWLAAAALAIAAAPAAAETYTNPILHADYSDPDVIRVGSDYYMVASSFHFSPGIPVLHSRDLVHWRIAGHVLPRLPFGPLYDMPGPHTLNDTISKPIGGTKYASGVWAPAIRHHDGRFYVTWATPDEGVFIASASDPAGPWSEPVQLIAGPGYEDPCPFWDDDGTAWLIHGKVGAGAASGRPWARRSRCRNSAGGKARARPCSASLAACRAAMSISTGSRPSRDRKTL